MFPYMIHTLVVAALCVAAFVAGMRTADRYHQRQESAVDYAMERQRLDLRAGVTPLSPATPYLAPLGKHQKEAS